RDGRAFVAEHGLPFLWRGATDFLLGWYLFSRDDGEALVSARMDRRVQQGFTVLRVFGMVDWTPIGGTVKFKPLDDWGRYQRSMRRLLQLARDRGLYIEWVLFTNADRTYPKSRMNEMVGFAADLASQFGHVFVRY